MTIMVAAEQLVILPIVDGYAETGMLHIPAPRGRGGAHWRLRDGCPPRTWLSVCGVEGDVYAAGGFPRAKLCPVCFRPDPAPSRDLAEDLHARVRAAA